MSERRCVKCGFSPNGSESAELAATAAEVYRCAVSWESEARLIGNVKAGDIAKMAIRVPELLRIVDELTKQNDPIWDATDGAHQAWWRGHDRAAAQFAAKLQEMNVNHCRLTDELRAKLAFESSLVAARNKTIEALSDANRELEAKLTIAEDKNRAFETWNTNMSIEASKWEQKCGELEEKLAEAEMRYEHSMLVARNLSDEREAETKRAEAAEARVRELESRG